MLTLHAKEWMAEKSITREMIMEAIKKGVTVRQTDGFLASYAYIKVAYKVRDNKYIIKTVFVR